MRIGIYLISINFENMRIFYYLESYVALAERNDERERATIILLDFCKR